MLNHDHREHVPASSPRPKHPLSLNQIAKLTNRPIEEIHAAVRRGELRQSVFFCKSLRVHQSEFERWLRAEGMWIDEAEVTDGR